MGTKRPNPNWAKLREQLWARSEGLCEVSGRPLDPDTFDAHHRRPKGMGGTHRPLTDSLCNLLALEPEVHNGAPWSVHQKPAWSRPRGYLLPKYVEDEPLTTVPVLYRGRQWVILDEEGDYGILTERAQRHLWRKLELAQPGEPPLRLRGSQYR